MRREGQMGRRDRSGETGQVGENVGRNTVEVGDRVNDRERNTDGARVRRDRAGDRLRDRTGRGGGEGVKREVLEDSKRLDKDDVT